jgi:iron complex transport system ATP-binding protein
LLQAVNVTFGYGERTVLDDVSFDVPAAGFVGIIGPNGSGKTTLLRLLAGTRKPQRGAVTMEGRALSSLPRLALARRMAVVPQETHLAFEYTVLEVALMGRYPHLGPFAIEGPADTAIAREALASTGTLSLEHRAFSTLSGGEKQRVIIASALAQIWSVGPWVRRAGGVASGDGREIAASASVVLLDEPTAALDLKYQIDIGLLLRELHDRHGLTIVLSTHDLNFAATLCDTLVMLKDGRVLGSGPLGDVLTPDNVRRLYDVEADVTIHPRTGHLTVVPLRTAGGRQ